VGAENDDRIALSADEIQLWSAPLNPSDEVLSALSQTLDPTERERARRFRFERDRRRWLAARGWLRHLLAGYLDADPTALRFESQAVGKPRLVAPSEWLRFNLSHSHELVVFAVGHDREVGVDIERVPVRAAADITPPCFLSERERSALSRYSGQARIRASLQCWTGKEAYLKGVGEGLREPVALIDVAPLLEHTLAAHPQAGLVLDGDWSLHTFDAGPDHVGSVAVQGPGARIPVVLSDLAQDGRPRFLVPAAP
jgi:4'-phosphopantetheinyl transferase